MRSTCTTGLEGAKLTRDLLQEIADKWTVLVLMACDGPRPVRFNEIKRRVGGIAPKTLASTLRHLERNGIVERRPVPGRIVGIEYEITDLGWTLAEPLGALNAWAEKYMPRVLEARLRHEERGE